MQFSPVEGMPWVKPSTSEDIVIAAEGLVGPEGEVVEADCFEKAFAWAIKEDNLLIVAGSIYLLSDFERFRRGA